MFLEHLLLSKHVYKTFLWKEIFVTPLCLQICLLATSIPQIIFFHAGGSTVCKQCSSSPAAYSCSQICECHCLLIRNTVLQSWMTYQGQCSSQLRLCDYAGWSGATLFPYVINVTKVALERQQVMKDYLEVRLTSMKPECLPDWTLTNILSCIAVCTYTWTDLICFSSLSVFHSTAILAKSFENGPYTLGHILTSLCIWSTFGDEKLDCPSKPSTCHWCVCW